MAAENQIRVQHTPKILRNALVEVLIANRKLAMQRMNQWTIRSVYIYIGALFASSCRETQPPKNATKSLHLIPHM